MRWLNDTSSQGRRASPQFKTGNASDPAATRKSLIDGVIQLWANISVMKAVSKDPSKLPLSLLHDQVSLLDSY